MASGLLPQLRRASNGRITWIEIAEYHKLDLKLNYMKEHQEVVENYLTLFLLCLTFLTVFLFFHFCSSPPRYAKSSGSVYTMA